MKADAILTTVLLASIVLDANVGAAPLPAATAQAAKKVLDNIPPAMRQDILAFIRTLPPQERHKLRVGAIHRGIFGNMEAIGINANSLTGITVDSQSTAVAAALEHFDIMEIDYRYDMNGKGVMSHAAHAARQTLLTKPWKDLDVTALTPEQRQMIIRRYDTETQTWGKHYLPLGGYVMTEGEFVNMWLACYPKKVALVDAKDDGAVNAFMMKRRFPAIAKQWIPMIYNTHFHSSKAFRDPLKERGVEITPEDTLAFTIHPNAMLRMAGYTEFNKDTDMFKVRDAQLKLSDDFIENFNISIAVFVVLPDAKYFDPSTNTVKDHPEFGTITDPAAVWAFGKLWVAAEVIKHLEKCHPGVIIAAASNRPVLVSGGKAVVDQVDTGKTVVIDPDTINGRLFEKMGQSKYLYEAGAHIIITESAEDMVGTEESYSIRDYPARNWDMTGLNELPLDEWLVDENFE